MVISLPYIFQVLYVLCFTRPRDQVSVYRTNGPMVLGCNLICLNLQVTKTCIKSWTSSNFGDLSIYCGVRCPRVSEKYPIDL